jgi:hypothetical protein
MNPAHETILNPTTAKIQILNDLRIVGAAMREKFIKGFHIAAA